ncbi:MAG: NADH-quinone oxidoreductase subunit NuoH [Terriglobia bacterium]
MAELVEAFQPYLRPTVLVVVAFLMLSLIAAAMIWIERKVLAHLQVRVGPMRVGPHGLLQPIADALKLLLKEDIVPAEADRFIFLYAPVISVIAAFTAFALVPFAPNFIITDVNVGILFLIGISSFGIFGIILGGWASNSHYPLLGAMRSTAQLVSYEVALGFAIVSALLLSGTLSMKGIVEKQAELGIWFVFLQPVAFFILFVASLAETNRNPFDLPEAESELVAGFHTEYSGFRFALFFMAEYTAMVLVSSIATTLFLGGWLRPFASVRAFDFLNYAPLLVFGAGTVWFVKEIFLAYSATHRFVLILFAVVAGSVTSALFIPSVLEAVQGVFWFLLKVFAFLFGFIWFRGTFPRYRFDQLMRLGWHFMIPVAIANIIFCGLGLILWQRLGWNLVGALWAGNLATLLLAVLLAGRHTYEPGT